MLAIATYISNVAFKITRTVLPSEVFGLTSKIIKIIKPFKFRNCIPVIIKIHEYNVFYNT